MLSKQTLFLYKLHFTVMYRLGFGLYKWNKQNQSLSVSTSIIRRLCSILFVILLWLYNLNLAASIMEGLLWDTSQARSIRLTLDILYAVIYTGAGCGAFIYYRQRHEMAYVITQTLRLNKQLTAQELKSQLPKSDGCGITALFEPAVAFYPVVMGAFFLVNNEAPRHMYRFIPAEYKSAWTMVAWALFEALLMCAGCMASLTNQFVMIPPTRCTAFWLQHFNRKANEKDLRRDDLTEGQKVKFLLKTFRVMRLLNICTNRALSSFVWPNAFYLMVVFTVFGGYGMVKLGGKVPGFIYIIFPVLAVSCVVCMFTLLPMQAKLTTESTLLLQSCLKADGVTLVEKKQIRAMKPIGIWVGSVFVIKKATALTIFMLASNLTINTILLH